MKGSEEIHQNPACIAIRRMAGSDVSALLSILQESPEASAWSEQSLLEAVSSDSTWVAVTEDRVIGFLIGRAAADEFEILNLAVARTARRLGVATQLVKAAFKSTHAGEARRIFLEVRASNDAAIAMYNRLGFRPCGRRSRYYQLPIEDAIILFRDRSKAD